MVVHWRTVFLKSNTCLRRAVYSLRVQGVACLASSARVQDTRAKHRGIWPAADYKIGDARVMPLFSRRAGMCRRRWHVCAAART
jgi:hypothetical protein